MFTPKHKSNICSCCLDSKRLQVQLLCLLAFFSVASCKYSNHMSGFCFAICAWYSASVLCYFELSKSRYLCEHFILPSSVRKENLIRYGAFNLFIFLVSLQYFICNKIMYYLLILCNCILPHWHSKFCYWSSLINIFNVVCDCHSKSFNPFIAHLRVFAALSEIVNLCCA